MSEIRNLVREVIEENNGRLMDEVLRDIIERRFDERWEEFAEEWFRKKSKELADKHAGGYIEAYVADFCSKSVMVSDGWGKESIYANMDEFIKAEIKNKFSSSWDIKNAVVRYVRETLSEIIDGVLEEKSKGLADGIMADLREVFADNGIKGGSK